jgi:hypothetical protein
VTDRIIQAPANRSATVDLGRHLFRKPILRRGHSIDYPVGGGKTRRITFDDTYLSNIANASKAGVFDLVPLVMDPGDNLHRERPEDFVGRVLGVEETADGLDAIVEVNDDATAKTLREYPELAVSPRLFENFSPDGKTEHAVPVAMKHLFVTANPRVAKLGQWQEASLSGHDAAVEILDLSAVEAPMPDRVDLSSAALQERWDALTDEERAELMAIADVLDAEGDPADDEDDDGIADELDDDETADDVPEGEPVSEDLSGADADTVDLAARGVIAAQGEEIAGLQQQLHGEQWARERDGLRLDGVPPWALDLAGGYLGDRQAAVVDLSGVTDETKNPAGIIRSLLRGMKGQIDLSGPRGYGGPYADNPELDENALIKDWFISQGHALPPGLA